ncbi:MAG: response regulator [Cyanobacteria bacterium J06576_12]
MMGTTLELQSELDKGSLFWFDIEVPEAHDWVASSITSQKGKILGYEGDKRTILVADDRWENRSVLTNLLEPIGFEMIMTPNGQEGLEKAIAHKPDLIITDISMALLDGYGLMTQLRASDDEKLKNVPIVVSSASVFEVDRYKSFEAGANEFVPKPVQAEVLLGALKKQLNLTWQYDVVAVSSDDNDVVADKVIEIVLPPKDSLTKLYDLSRRGLVPMLIKEAEAIQAKQPECEGFVQPLIKFAKGFQLKKMRDFLEQYVDTPAE